MFVRKMRKLPIKCGSVFFSLKAEPLQCIGQTVLPGLGSHGKGPGGEGGRGVG